MSGVDFNTIQRVHFIGIGGIGISAIARMFLLEGKRVTGSDASGGEVVEELRKLSAHISIGQSEKNVPEDTELIVYTIAIKSDNPEFMKAKSLGVFILSYPEALNVISKEKYTIAIAGTHGKTTTTAMTAEVLIAGGLDPTVIVGSMLKREKSNFISGKSKYFVVEACEYRRSFLNLEPTILAITNVDADHLDYYKDIADIESAFRQLAEKVPSHGLIVCDPKDERVARIIQGLSPKIFDYTLYLDQKVELKVPGEHNRKNATIARSIADFLSIDAEIAKKALSDFSGTWRRFEYKGKTTFGALVYDDYAHHPTEVEATLLGAREMFPDKNIIVVFQPHLYSRTRDHLEEFGKAFSDADRVLLAPIYAAREVDDGSISTAILRERVSLHNKETQAFPSLKDISQFLSSCLTENDLVITMGAGDVYHIADELIKG